MSLNKPEPPPKTTSGDTWMLVISDMKERRAGGIKKYKKPLQPFNGRNSLVDAYQEALDLVVYLRNEISERTLIVDPPPERSPDALSSAGYDGLYVPDGCACVLDDLEPCGEMRDDCEPGFYSRCDCGDHLFHIGPRGTPREDVDEDGCKPVEADV